MVAAVNRAGDLKSSGNLLGRLLCGIVKEAGERTVTKDSIWPESFFNCKLIESVVVTLQDSRNSTGLV